MDRRDEIALPGSGSFYMQRGMAGSGAGMQGSLGIRSITSIMNASYQSNMGTNSFESALPMDSSPAISPHGVNVGAAPVAAPQTEQVRRKRGRPRKYGSDGGVSLALSPTSSARSVGSTTTQKRGRGRPPGTGRKRQLSSTGDWLSGSAGTSFTPHVITIAVGEDIAAKVMSFSQESSRAICVLSARGSVSMVTLRQQSSSSGTVTYEGQFEILCLSGSFLLSDNGGSTGGRNGGLSVSLASPDGHVVGGGVGGVLIAASHVQVIVGSFLWGNSKTKNKARESLDSGGELDRQRASVSVLPARSQNLSPTSSVGVWPGSHQPMDMQNVHVDIDLMHG